MPVVTPVEGDNMSIQDIDLSGLDPVESRFLKVVRDMPSARARTASSAR